MRKTENGKKESPKFNEFTKITVNSDNNPGQPSNKLNSYNNIGFYESNNSSSSRTSKRDSQSSSAQTFNPKKNVLKTELRNNTDKIKSKDNIIHQESKYNNNISHNIGKGLTKTLIQLRDHSKYSRNNINNLNNKTFTMESISNKIICNYAGENKINSMVCNNAFETLNTKIKRDIHSRINKASSKKNSKSKKKDNSQKKNAKNSANNINNIKPKEKINISNKSIADNNTEITKSSFMDARADTLNPTNNKKKINSIYPFDKTNAINKNLKITNDDRDLLVSAIIDTNSNVNDLCDKVGNLCNKIEGFIESQQETNLLLTNILVKLVEKSEGNEKKK